MIELAWAFNASDITMGGWRLPSPDFSRERYGSFVLVFVLLFVSFLLVALILTCSASLITHAWRRFSTASCSGFAQNQAGEATRRRGSTKVDTPYHLLELKDKMLRTSWSGKMRRSFDGEPHGERNEIDETRPHKYRNHLESMFDFIGAFSVRH